MDIKVSADIEALVNDTIEASLAEALSKRGSSIAESIVKGVLNLKEGYGKQTVLQEAIEHAIKAETKKQIRAWLEQNKSVVTNLVDEGMRKLLTPELVTQQILTQLKSASIRMKPFDADWTDGEGE